MKVLKDLQNANFDNPPHPPRAKFFKNFFQKNKKIAKKICERKFLNLSKKSLVWHHKKNLIFGAMKNYKIVWTENATTQYEQNLKYLLEEWNLKVMRDFITKMEEFLSRLKTFPKMGVLYENSRYRRFVVVEQISVFYRYNNDCIFIVSVWNNYQKPIEF